MSEQACPRCGSQARQRKAGINSGRQQYRCAQCGRRYVLESKGRGYGDNLKEQAAQLREEGHTLREIADILGVTIRTLSNWFQQSEAVRQNFDEAEGQSTDEAAAVIASGMPSRRRVTIHDVAEQAGVAVSTVSNYLNNKGTIAIATRDRIKSAVDDLHFTPNGLMRAIRERRTRILGLLTYGLSVGADLDNDGDSITRLMMSGLEDATAAAEHDLLLYVNWRQRSLGNSLPFLDGHIDGLLFVGPSLKDPILERLAAAGLPTVALLSRHVPPNVGYVNTDNIGAMSMVVDHLASLGKRRIGYVGMDHGSNYIDRFNAVREALKAAGLTVDSSLVKMISSSSSKSWPKTEMIFERAILSLIETTDRLDAIVSPDDWTARWTIKALTERGIRVPEDVAVVGFDDLRFARDIGLTTIRQPFRKIGKTAVEALLAMIDGAPASECQITLPGELIVRSSTVPSK